MSAHNSYTSTELPLVSVVIPSYNRQADLRVAIESVVHQDYGNLEILVVDDGSEENLKLVCEEFADPRIVYLRNALHTNGNVARNTGIRHATGAYIAMLDSDDLFLPHHITRRVEMMEKWGCDGIFGSAYIFDGTQTKLQLSRPRRLSESMVTYVLSDGFAQTSTHFYKASCIKQVLWDEMLLWHQDYDLLVRFADQYMLKNDYEPTVQVNWITGAKRRYAFDSCIRFLEQNMGSVQKQTLALYAIQMHKLATEYAQKQASQYYFKILKNNIVEISLKQYLSAFPYRGKMNKLRKVLSFQFFLFQFYFIPGSN